MTDVVQTVPSKIQQVMDILSQLAIFAGAIAIAGIGNGYPYGFIDSRASRSGFIRHGGIGNGESFLPALFIPTAGQVGSITISSNRSSNFLRAIVNERRLVFVPGRESNPHDLAWGLPG